MSSPEKVSIGPEQKLDTVEMEAINHEQREALRDSLEKAEQDHKLGEKTSLQEVKNQAVEQAKNAESTAVRIEKSPAEKRTPLITRRHREQSFKKQMEEIQPHLSSSERLFGKVIHNKTIESVSDTTAQTIARPNALLSGSISAFLLVTIVYLLAKHYGYPLSGFETIAAFALGWVLGLIYDYARLLIAGKRTK